MVKILVDEETLDGLTRRVTDLQDELYRKNARVTALEDAIIRVSAMVGTCKPEAVLKQVQELSDLIK